MTKKQEKRILIIEDERGLIEIFSRKLKDAGYCCLSAQSQQDALELLRKEGLDLVILDLILPFSSGMDLYERIKNDFPGIKVMVASVWPVEEQELAVFDADDYYCKSENISELVRKVNRLLG